MPEKGQNKRWKDEASYMGCQPKVLICPITGTADYDVDNLSMVSDFDVHGDIYYNYEDLGE